MANFTVVNGSRADVTAGGIAVRRLSYRDGIALTSAQIAALIGKGIAVTKDMAGQADAFQIKRDITVASMFLSGEDGPPA